MGTLRTVLNKLNMDNSLLLKAKRERDISEQVTLYSNPISKRVVEHSMRMQDHLMDLVYCVTFGVQVLVATPNNLPQVNLAFSLVLSPIQQMRDRIKGDEEKHQIAKTSDLGWKLVSNLEGQVGRISMVDLRTQE